MMAGTGLHHDVGGGNGEATGPCDTGEFVRRVPDIRRQGKLHEVSLHVSQHPALMAASSAVPQLRADERAPCGASRGQQCCDSFPDRTISVSSQAVDPCRGIYQRHGVSRNSSSSAGEMRLSQVPRWRTRAATRARRLKSATAVTTASRFVLAPVISIASFNIASGISIDVFMLPRCPRQGASVNACATHSLRRVVAAVGGAQVEVHPAVARLEVGDVTFAQRAVALRARLQPARGRLPVPQAMRCP